MLPVITKAEYFTKKRRVPKGRTKPTKEKQDGQTGKTVPKVVPNPPKNPDFVVCPGGQIFFFLCQIKKEMVRPNKIP